MQYPGRASGTANHGRYHRHDDAAHSLCGRDTAGDARRSRRAATTTDQCPSVSHTKNVPTCRTVTLVTIALTSETVSPNGNASSSSGSTTCSVRNDFDGTRTPQCVAVKER